MANSFPCGYCTTPISFEDWERGTEAYCSSCGRMCQVPTEDSPSRAEAQRSAAENTSAVSGLATTESAAPPTLIDPEVFTDRRDSSALARVVGHVSCPACQKPVPVTAQDYGGSTYCPGCGVEVPVGEAFVTPASPMVPQGQTTTPDTPEPSTARATRSSALRLVLLSSLAVLGLLGAAAVTYELRRPRVPSIARAATPRVTKPLPRPDAHITPEAITLLSQRVDTAEALARAEEWRSFLSDLEVPSTDPRLPQLDTVIAEFRLRLRPELGPETEFVKQFREQVRALNDALLGLPPDAGREEPKLASAREAIARADALLAEHPKELEPRADPYRMLRGELERLVAQLEGPRPIEALLDQARRQIDADQPTEALETFARARLRVLIVRLSDHQRADLGRRYDALFNGPLWLAFSRRAAEESEEADRRGDTAARDRQLREARAQLHRGMANVPEDAYAELSTRIKALEGSRSRENRRPSPTESHEERQSYENVLEHFATWRLREPRDVPAWIEGGRKLYMVARRLPARHAAWSRTLSDLTLEGLRAGADVIDKVPQLDQETVAALVSLRDLLSTFESWKSRPEWQVFNQELSRRGNDVARRLLELAYEQQEQDHLVQAMGTAVQAETLSTETELTERARTLKTECQTELALRADRKGQDEARARLQKLVSDRNYLDAWSELIQFKRRFPKTSHASELSRVEQEVEAALREQVPALLQQCASLERDRRYDESHRLCERLATAPIPTEQRALWDSLSQRHAARKQQADALFARIPSLSFTRDRQEVLSVLDQLASVLKLNPDHAAALTRRRQVWAQAQRHASELLKSAEVMQRYGRFEATQREAQRRRLYLVLKLSPTGEFADRARKLLKAIGG